MGIQTSLENVVRTEDGPYECYDAVVTARDISQLYKTGFLKIDDDRQRGIDSVTGLRIMDDEKVDRWAEQLLKGEAYLGQLSWNFRKDETILEYDETTKSLKIGAGAATIPDSGHRHKAILKAAESVQKGSSFSLERRVSVRIYNVPASEENRIFYAMNQEGKKADPTRSKWLHRIGATKIAGALTEQCPSLRDNVDTIRDRLSKKNPRLCAFNTLSGAFEAYWSDCDAENEQALQADVDYVVQYWNKLAEVRPELSKLDIARRKKVRETLLVDSALAISAYVAIARKIRERGLSLTVLEKLAEPSRIALPDGEGTREFDLFSRENPMWERLGILVPSTKRTGQKVFTLRNARQTRDAMLKALEHALDLEDQPALKIES
jgi:DndB-like DNA-sulfur modification-associated protein